MRMSEAEAPPTGLLMKRYKFIWRLLLVSNFALGGHFCLFLPPFHALFSFFLFSLKLLNNAWGCCILLSPVTSLACYAFAFHVFDILTSTTFCAFAFNTMTTCICTLFSNPMAKRRDSMEIHGRTAQKLQKGKAIVEVPPEPITSLVDLNYDDFFVPVTTPVEVRAPIPEEQQREIFKWMLEEKRKVKPKNPVEKKQIDEEKAILKQFLRAKSIPKF